MISFTCSAFRRPTTITAEWLWHERMVQWSCGRIVNQSAMSIKPSCCIGVCQLLLLLDCHQSNWLFHLSYVRLLLLLLLLLYIYMHMHTYIYLSVHLLAFTRCCIWIRCILVDLHWVKSCDIEWSAVSNVALTEWETNCSGVLNRTDNVIELLESVGL